MQIINKISTSIFKNKIKNIIFNLCFINDEKDDHNNHNIWLSKSQYIRTTGVILEITRTKLQIIGDVNFVYSTSLSYIVQAHSEIKTTHIMLTATLNSPLSFIRRSSLSKFTIIFFWFFINIFYWYRHSFVWRIKS